jgi:hypothetical protein
MRKIGSILVSLAGATGRTDALSALRAVDSAHDAATTVAASAKAGLAVKAALCVCPTAMMAIAIGTVPVLRHAVHHATTPIAQRSVPAASCTGLVSATAPTTPTAIASPSLVRGAFGPAPS